MCEIAPFKEKDMHIMKRVKMHFKRFHILHLLHFDTQEYAYLSLCIFKQGFEQIRIFVCFKNNGENI